MLQKTRAVHNGAHERGSGPVSGLMVDLGKPNPPITVAGAVHVFHALPVSPMCTKYMHMDTCCDGYFTREAGYARRLSQSKVSSGGIGREIR